jgi:predicted RNase H-like nuclease (RuvC/YqgF family)
VSSELKGLSKPRSPKIQTSSPLLISSAKRKTDQIDSAAGVSPAIALSSLEDCPSHVEEEPWSGIDLCSNPNENEHEHKNDTDEKLGSSKLLEERLLVVEKLLEMERGNSRDLKRRLEEAERELMETKHQVARSEDFYAEEFKELQLISAEIVEIRRTLEERDLELGKAHGKLEEFRRKCENPTFFLWALGTSQLLTFFTFFIIKWGR